MKRHHHALLGYFLIHLSTLATAQTESPRRLQVEINGAPMEETMHLDDDSFLEINNYWQPHEMPATDQILVNIDIKVPIRNATVHAPEGTRCFFWLSDYVPEGDGAAAAAATDVSLDRDDLAPLVRLENGKLVGTHKSPVFGHGEYIPSTLSFADDEHTYDMLICYQAADDDVVVFLQQWDGDYHQALTVVRVPPKNDRVLVFTEIALFDVLQASIIESPDPAMECEVGRIPEITRHIDPGNTDYVSIRVDQPSEEVIFKVEFVDCGVEKF